MEATVTPINTGESLFGLEEGFRPLIENNAVDIIHVDRYRRAPSAKSKRRSYPILRPCTGFRPPSTSPGSPVGCMAAVHMISDAQDSWRWRTTQWISHGGATW